MRVRSRRPRRRAACRGERQVAGSGPARVCDAGRDERADRIPPQRAARRAGEFPPAPEPLPGPVLDSHTHLDITVGEAGVPGGGPADDPVAAAIAWPPRSASTGWSRSASTSTSSRWGADAGRAARRPCWPPSRCTPTRRPGWPTSTRRCARSRRSPPTPGYAGSARPGWTSSAPATRGGPRRSTASGRTSPSPSGTASRWSSTTATRTPTCCASSTTRARPDRWSCTASPATPSSPAECVRRGFLLSFAGTVTFANARRCARPPRSPRSTRCWWRPTRRT